MPLSVLPLRRCKLGHESTRWRTGSSSAAAQFTSPAGEALGPQIEVPLGLTSAQLNGVVNELLGNERSEPYSFYVNDQEVVQNLGKMVEEQRLSTEMVLSIVYQPQATFRVVAVTRCTGTLSGHTEAILCVAFSPDCKRLLTGSGDGTLRLWELSTETPVATLKGHTNWVLCCAFSPDGRLCASGAMDKDARIWNPFDGKPVHRFSTVSI